MLRNVFLALDLDADTVARAVARQQELRAVPELRTSTRSTTFVAAEKMHVTVRYVGDVERTRAPALIAVTRELAAHTPPPRLRSARLDAFPSPRRARVLVLELDDPAGDLAALAARAEQAVQALGHPAEPRAYRPHLTLARPPGIDFSRLVEGPDALPPVELGRATHLVLYSSPQGEPTYADLVRLAL